MPLSEIEKLERRYAENPQGLTFAPLAEVHRKNGDVARALELLRPGLELHPDYIPASIVLGRCHLDLGDLPAAETAFTHVLELDGENVIALKALADVNERLHHFDRAQSWLQQLLSLDRSNDEARAQLERIETARAQASEVAARASLSEAPVESEVEGAVSGDAVVPDAVVQEAVVEEKAEKTDDAFETPALPPAEELPPPPEPIALEELEFSRLEEAVYEPPPAGLEIEDLELTKETTGSTVEPIAGLIGRDVDQPEDGEWAVETSEDIVLRSSGGSEFQVPDASLELFASRRAPDPGPFGESKPADQPPAPPVEEPPAPKYVEMAELQPEPVSERPAPDLVAHAEPRSVVYREPEPEAARPRFTAAETRGESVSSFFGKLLSAILPAGEAGPIAQPAPTRPSVVETDAGAPTRPAADALSLSSVFGEEPTTHPPAVPAPGAPVAGVSFDEFYGPSGPAGGGRTPRSPDAKNDDLDQFHAWLQNLKR